MSEKIAYHNIVDMLNFLGHFDPVIHFLASSRPKPCLVMTDLINKRTIQITGRDTQFIELVQKFSEANMMFAARLYGNVEDLYKEFMILAQSNFPHLLTASDCNVN